MATAENYTRTLFASCPKICQQQQLVTCGSLQHYVNKSLLHHRVLSPLYPIPTIRYCVGTCTRSPCQHDSLHPYCSKPWCHKGLVQHQVNYTHCRVESVEVRRKGVMVAMTTIGPTLIMIGEKGAGMAVWLNQLH